MARVITDNAATGGQPTALIDKLYQGLLGRSPDTSGLAYWTNQIAQGMSAADVAAAFLDSPEYVARAISLDYQQLLHRNPDAPGLAYFASEVESRKIDFDDVVADLVASTEFSQQAGASGAAWVDSVYARLLGRSEDSADLAFWLGELAMPSMSRGQIAQMFVFSDEYLTSQVMSWYEGLLGTTPTSQQVSEVVKQLASGQNESLVMAKLIAAGSS